MDPLTVVLGLLTGATTVIGVMWREDRRIYRERIVDLTGQRNRAEDREDVALAGWRAQTDANAAIAAKLGVTVDG